jgi:hypothetical protein
MEHATGGRERGGAESAPDCRPVYSSPYGGAWSVGHDRGVLGSVVVAAVADG